jgi:hypothetical protein
VHIECIECTTLFDHAVIVNKVAMLHHALDNEEVVESCSVEKVNGSTAALAKGQEALHAILSVEDFGRCIVLTANDPCSIDFKWHS